jgi:transposase
MRSIRDILRFSFELGVSANEISKITGVSRGAVQNCLRSAKARNILPPIPDEWDDTTLEEAIFGPKRMVEARLVEPDWQYIFTELKRAGVNRELLWEEYMGDSPEGKYSYSQFNRRFRAWLKKQELSMRQEHKAGERLSVDYAGDTVPLVVDRQNGVVEMAQIFLAVLEASNYTYVEASRSQGLHDWINSHVRALNFFKGVPECLVPDNLKSGVTKADQFDPLLNPTYRRLAKHYHCSVRPARKQHPKDKAKVEKGVQFAETWILARLRNYTFFSLAQLNDTIQELLVELNNKQFQKLAATRRSLYESIDLPALKPLPKTPFEFEDWLIGIKVEKDYHINVAGHYYSVPCQLRGERVDVRYTDHIVEILRHNVRVTSHPRSWIEGAPSTLDEHRPPQHALYAGMSADKFLDQAQSVGTFTHQVISQIIQSHPYPQLAYDKCFGILSSLRRKYGDEKLEAASEYAVRIGSPCYRVVKSALETECLPQQLTITMIDSHPNIRGPEEFAPEGEQHVDESNNGQTSNNETGRHGHCAPEAG